MSQDSHKQFLERRLSELPMEGVQDIIDIITSEATYHCKPNKDSNQWLLTGGGYTNELVELLGSCPNFNPTQLVKSVLILGNSLVFKRQSGAKVVTMPIDVIKTLKPATKNTKYTGGLILDERYELKELIGKGGFGSVYRAQHLKLERSVAIKILQIGDKQSPETTKELLQRFQREIQLLTRINHPYIANIIDQGTTASEDPYMVMDYIQGDTLRKYIKKHHPISCQKAYKIFRQIALAVYALHEMDILHRDIKPDNIIVQYLPGNDEIIRLLDFGIAKLLHNDAPNAQALTTMGAIMGTLDYMSPEQCEGSDVDLRTDIYSLGAIAYEMLTGKTPFSGTTSVDLIFKHLREVPKPLTIHRLDISVELSDVILKAMEKRPKKRYNNTLEFIEAFDKALPVAKASVISSNAPTAKLPASSNLSSGQLPPEAKLHVPTIANKTLSDLDKSRDTGTLTATTKQHTTAPFNEPSSNESSLAIVEEKFNTLSLLTGNFVNSSTVIVQPNRSGEEELPDISDILCYDTIIGTNITSISARLGKVETLGEENTLIVEVRNPANLPDK